MFGRIKSSAKKILVIAVALLLTVVILGLEFFLCLTN
jgi:hypothetical protein